MVAPGAVVNHSAERYEIQSGRPEEKPGAPPGSGYFRNIVGSIPFGTNRHSGGLENEPIGICPRDPTGTSFCRRRAHVTCEGSEVRGQHCDIIMLCRDTFLATLQHHKSATEVSTCGQKLLTRLFYLRRSLIRLANLKYMRTL